MQDHLRVPRAMSIATNTEQALAIVGSEQPALATRLASGLGPRVVRVDVDDEHFDIVADRGRVRVRPCSTEGSDVHARTSVRTLKAVLAGTSSLDDAILSDAIELFGDPDELVELEDLLALFVNAAVRSPSMAALWERFVAEPGGNGT